LGYVSKYKWLLALGLFFNLLGMVGEFASPWFIGEVIDRVATGKFDEVSGLTI